MKGGADLVEKLKADENLAKNKDAAEALEDLDVLFKYCAIFNLSNKVFKIDVLFSMLLIRIELKERIYISN